MEEWRSGGRRTLSYFCPKLQFACMFVFDTRPFLVKVIGSGLERVRRSLCLLLLLQSERVALIRCMESSHVLCLSRSMFAHTRLYFSVWDTNK